MGERDEFVALKGHLIDEYFLPLGRTLLVVDLIVFVPRAINGVGR